MHHPDYWWPEGHESGGEEDRPRGDALPPTPPPPGEHDVPPPDEYDAPPPDEYDAPPAPLRERGNERVPETGALTERVVSTLRAVLSSLHGMEATRGLQIIRRIAASKQVHDILDVNMQETLEGVLEVLSHELSVLDVGRLDLGDLPVASEYSTDVREELDRIADTVGDATPKDPHAAWADLVEVVQRHASRQSALKLARSIEAKQPLSRLMEKYRAVQPPTAKKVEARERRARTGRQVAENARAIRAGRHPYRFSSGLPTLDRGYTGVDEALGFVAPGQLTVVMGPTGTGKTSFSYTVTPAIGQDLVNWGLKDAKQVFFHTEEESVDKLRGFRMDLGQKHHHLSDRLILEAVGTSRTRMAETLYDLVIEADEKARETRRPIAEFLPHVVQLDYIQSIQEAGEDPTTATAMTAEFLLRGVCAWNPDEMAKFSGVDFREYAGMGWPSGMEDHSVAVIAYAQLVKISDETLTYKPGKRGVQLSDFVLTDEKDEPYWEVREGDLRLFGKNQMRGSGVIAQNAHSIIILHRSIPYNNPARRGEDGELHLTDTRARIMFDKSRTGSRLPYAPMRFDIQSNGFRAQYYDELAERAAAAGKIDIHSSYTEPGDPMLPVRPTLDPLAACRY